jgi:DivIVA domain-containing protein
MALTPEDVVNKRFTITKFRDGYDLDQVDDFLDEVVAEFKRYEDQIASLTEEKDRLAAELAKAKQTDDAPAAPVPAVAATPEVVSTETGAVAAEEAVKSSHMLQLAMELHDKHIFEGEKKRDQLISDAEKMAHELVSTAQKKRAEDLEVLSKEIRKTEKHIAQLREFESEYRGTLTSYIQGQLRELEGSPEQDNYPVLK